MPKPKAEGFNNKYLLYKAKARAFLEEIFGWKPERFYEKSCGWEVAGAGLGDILSRRISPERDWIGRKPGGFWGEELRGNPDAI